jgi:hypothetical protein
MFAKVKAARCGGSGILQMVPKARGCNDADRGKFLETCPRMHFPLSPGASPSAGKRRAPDIIITILQRVRTANPAPTENL